VSIRSAVPVIEHERISRYVDVAANVSDRVPGDVAHDLQQRLEKVNFPLEYHAEFVGKYTEEQDAQRRVLGLGVAAAVGVFLLLQAAFHSWRLALITFFLMPVALAGGVLAMWFGGEPMTLATVAGLLALLALAIRSSVGFVLRCQQLREADVPFGRELVVTVAGERFGPTIITAVVTATALLPIVVMRDVAGLEVLYRMAVVILGGLVTSVLVACLLLPSLYLRYGPRREPEPLELEIDLAHEERRLAEASVGDG
jgi:Cu/Ag efflux pump CusA